MKVINSKIPPKRSCATLPETLAFIALKKGCGLQVDSRSAKHAIHQYAWRHGIKITMRKLDEDKWAIWKI